MHTRAHMHTRMRVHAHMHMHRCPRLHSGGAFSIGCLHTTHIGRGPRSTRIEHSVHMAMCPHGTSNTAVLLAKRTRHS